MYNTGCNLYIPKHSICTSSIKIDYNRGVVFVNRTRIAEWKLSGNTTRVVADASKLKEVNINVEPEKIYDAVDELLQE